jgi:hypothetical protein
MAYQFADGFDNYGTAFVMVAGYPWDFAPNAAEVTSTADFRFAPPAGLPGGCVAMGNSGNVLRKNLSGNLTPLIAGVGFKISALPTSTAEIISFWDAGTEQCCLTVNNLGALQFFRGAGTGTAIGAASPNATIAANTWYGVAVQVTFAGGSSGSVAAYLNGSTVALINSTGLNTISSANSYANQVGIGGNVNAAPSCKYDDFYCFDTTGVFLNALLGGDARIITKMPTGAGNYTNWTPNGLGSNFQNAAVQPPSTSDYNANNVSTTKDSYAMQSAGLGVAPYVVMARASMERDDAGPHTPSIFVRSSSTDSAGVVTPALSASYLFYDAVFQNDPATNAIWTGAGADNAQVGVIEG